ncbi:LCP family protein [Actinomadura sp. WAC 06369]|uniref:LCP family protein n=1 Tax=Actinomadura sp. WAC 06369 TaxID=2203193 RepID=UPI000F7B66B9|nr:LCP family protein [Actinomadura sp. WAC 06369]RSN55898.1 LytR family transcriptional regulator [Actinomadura sp. WAC 06369]
MRDEEPEQRPADGRGRSRARGGQHRAARRGRPGRPGGRNASYAVAEALLMAAVSPALPGLAHLRAGRIRLGGALLAAQAVLLTAAALAFAHLRPLFLQLSVRPGWLTAAMACSVVLAALWALLIVHSYLVLAPAGLSPPWRLAGGTTVSVLCLLVIVPPLTVAHYGHLQRDLVDSVFADGPAPPAAQAGGTRAPAPAPGGASPDRDPWAGVPRLNVLLLGGDADTGRPGVRTDSMTLASVDTGTGDTVLLSLPRNLQHVPVWSDGRRVPYPADGLLNAVYGLGTDRPDLLAGGGRAVRDPGAELLKRTVSHILGLPVPYYVMVDMRSFRQIVDAVGGVRVCVAEPVPVPRSQVPAGVLRPGCRTLTGREALWYGRSRTGSSDYVRMGRQKCLLWALARQAGPLTVLRSFQRLTEVFKESVGTDLPQRLLPALVDLSAKIRDADVRSLQFVPPVVSPGRPDYAAIRRMAARALRDGTGPDRGARPLPVLADGCG